MHRRLAATHEARNDPGTESDQDLVVWEATVSGAHAILRWVSPTASWSVEDLGSTNGCYAALSCERRARVDLSHGGAVQLGELGLKLVSFAPGSHQHSEARNHLACHDGLTGLLAREHFMRATDKAVNGCVRVIMSVRARDELREPWTYRAVRRIVAEQDEHPTILELLTLREVARSAVQQIEWLLAASSPVVAGRTGPLDVSVLLPGISVERARRIVEQVLAWTRRHLPDTLEVAGAVSNDSEE